MAINGSASARSSNEKLIERFAAMTKDCFRVAVFNDLKVLPPFDPELSTDNPPQIILDFRRSIETAVGVLICTPEYVFSIPSGLKNALEWCVSTTVFSGKPTGLITASAHGEKGHAELQLIMETLAAKFTVDTTLLIRGVKGKIDSQGHLSDDKTKEDFTTLVAAYKHLIETKP